jgi:hypothetical protein
VKVEQQVIQDSRLKLSFNDGCTVSTLPSSTMTLMEAAQLLQVQQGTICQLGAKSGLNMAAYLSVNPTAKIITFQRDEVSYTQVMVQSLQRLFPSAHFQLITGDLAHDVAEYNSVNPSAGCNHIYIGGDSDSTQSLRNLYSMKALADEDWHIVIMDNVSTTNGVRQAWLEAQHDGVLERVAELDDLLLPQDLQRSSPFNVKHEAGAADTVTVLTNYTDMAVGRYTSPLRRSSCQHFKRRVRIHSNNGDLTAELYVNHALDRSGA